LPILDLAIQQSPTIVNIRPTSDDEWKSLFPENLDKNSEPTWPASKKTKASFKSKTPRATRNPFWKAGHNDQDLYNLVSDMLLVMAQSREKLDVDRLDKRPWIRAVVVTTAKWEATSKSMCRDWTPLCAWALAESYIVKTYRPALLEGVAGTIRRDLDEVLAPFVVDKQSRLQPVEDVPIAGVLFPWWDCIAAPSVAMQGQTSSQSIEELAIERTIIELSIANQAEIQSLINAVERSKVAHNNLDGGKTVDHRVSMALDELILVSHSLNTQILI
jgi:hypothetical protein